MLTKNFFYIILDKPEIQYLVLAEGEVKDRKWYIITIMNSEPFEVNNSYVMINEFYWVPHVSVVPSDAPLLAQLVPRGKIDQSTMDALRYAARGLAEQELVTTFGQ